VSALNGAHPGKVDADIGFTRYRLSDTRKSETSDLRFSEKDVRQPKKLPARQSKDPQSLRVARLNAAPSRRE
jgi:hypothetical protein